MSHGYQPLEVLDKPTNPLLPSNKEEGSFPQKQ